MIREARREELGKLAELEARCFDDPWSRDQLRPSVEDEGHLCLVADPEGEIAAYALFLRGPGDAELLRIATRPGRRRQGLARALLRRGLEILLREGRDRCYLEVRERLEPARALYESEGFESIGKRPRYYPDGSTAVLYRAALVP